jgi:alkanesulfonate monooxygenase SsuD/methylene tetrahydromethanopterin reductase-like flavin-dependent oxidoreductase (luciferase family)
MRFGLMFSHQVPPGSGIGPEAPYRDMLRCLPRAEELGYESVFQVSHHVQPDGLCPSPLIAMAGAAAVTERMRIGTGCLLVPLYAPLKLAEDVAVLDCLSGGRFVFGVAPGYVSEEFAAHGVPREQRVARFWEALDLCQAAWTQETFSFDGRFFDVCETSVTPKPVQTPVPVWYGLSGPKSLARAAGRGGVLMPSPRHGVEEIRAHLDVWRAAGGAVDTLPVMREVFIAETTAKAEELAAPAVTYLFRELYGKKSAAGERVLRDDAGRVVDAQEQVDFEHFKARYVIGDPDFAIAEVARLRDELGATDVLCWMHLPGIAAADAMRSVELFAREVLPACAGAA